jgi:hypothetical protein
VDVVLISVDIDDIDLVFQTGDTRPPYNGIRQKKKFPQEDRLAHGEVDQDLCQKESPGIHDTGDIVVHPVCIINHASTDDLTAELSTIGWILQEIEFKTCRDGIDVGAGIIHEHDDMV